MGRSRIANEYSIHRNTITVIIPRNDGTEILVYMSKQDEFLLKQGRLQVDKTNRYNVVYWPWRDKSDEVRRRNTLSREIMKAPSDLFVDHINHDPLDNRRINLRLVTASENAQNRAGATWKSKSGIRGVFWDKHKRKWMAQASIKGKPKFVKFFENIKEAEIAIIRYRAKYMPCSSEDVGG